MLLHLTRDFPPREAGGISIAVGAMASLAASFGVRQQVVSFDAWRPRNAGDAPPALETTFLSDGSELSVIRVGTGVSLDAALHAAAQHAAGPTPVSVIHLHDALLLDFALSLQEALGGVPELVFTPHVMHNAALEVRSLDTATLSSRAEARALERATRVHAFSSGMAERLGFAHADARVVLAPPPPAPPARTTPPSSAPNDLLSAPSLAGSARDTAFDVAVFGRFSDLKGTDVAAHAIGLLAQRRNVRAIFIGGLPESPKAERRWCQRIQRAAGTAEVHITGWLARNEALDVLATARVLLAPSRQETWGYQLEEASRLGLQLICSTCVGHSAQSAALPITASLSPSAPAAAYAQALDRALAAPAKLSSSVEHQLSDDSRRAFKKLWSVSG